MQNHLPFYSHIPKHFTKCMILLIPFSQSKSVIPGGNITARCGIPFTKPLHSHDGGTQSSPKLHTSSGLVPCKRRLYTCYNLTTNYMCKKFCFLMQVIGGKHLMFLFQKHLIFFLWLLHCAAFSGIFVLHCTAFQQLFQVNMHQMNICDCTDVHAHFLFKSFFRPFLIFLAVQVMIHPMSL